MALFGLSPSKSCRTLYFEYSNRKPTAYHNLLVSLGLSNKVVSDMNRRRQRDEQVRSDTEDADDEDEENSASEDRSSTDGEDDEEEDSECSDTDEENYTKVLLQSDAPYGTKPNLFEHWLQLYKEAGGEKFGSSARRRFFSICNSYMDILHSNKKPFYNGDRGEARCDAKEFNDVIQTLGFVRHENLVPLLGFYGGNRGEKLMVHPFFSSGDLSDFIKSFLGVPLD
ncbi:Protein kinase-like domain protein [Raphanus sativus]|nr:Protein kinase-like domain protein [Raphanus sativus]